MQANENRPLFGVKNMHTDEWYHSEILTPGGPFQNGVYASSKDAAQATADALNGEARNGGWIVKERSKGMSTRRRGMSANTESEVVRKTLEEARDLECDWCAKGIDLNAPDEAHSGYWHHFVYLNRPDEHLGPLACTASGINGLLARAGHDPVALLSELETAHHTICGFGQRLPDFRKIPDAFSAIFRVGDAFVLPDGGTIDEEHFDRLVEDERITLVDPEPAREGHCIYLSEGDAAPEYISLKEAADRFRVFADEQTLRGDALFESGDEKAALTHYEKAAAATQSPDCYEKMLLCPMSERRREIIERLYADVT